MCSSDLVVGPGGGLLRPEETPEGVDDFIIQQSFTWSQEASVQFMHSLRDKVFVYAFGERLTLLTVTGIAGMTCKTSRHGLKWVDGFYKAYTVSNRETPIFLTINCGSSFITLRGFLVGFDSAVENTQLNLARVVLKFVVLPVA